MSWSVAFSTFSPSTATTTQSLSTPAFAASEPGRAPTTATRNDGMEPSVALAKPMASSCRPTLASWNVTATSSLTMAPATAAAARRGAATAVAPMAAAALVFAKSMAPRRVARSAQAPVAIHKAAQSRMAGRIAVAGGQVAKVS